MVPSFLTSPRFLHQFISSKFFQIIICQLLYFFQAMINRSIFRSNKNVQLDTENKKVQVRMVSQGQIEDLEDDAGDRREEKENLSPQEKSKRTNLSVQRIFKAQQGMELKRSKEKCFPSSKSCTSIKGCLKKEPCDEKKPPTPDEEECDANMDMKSSKSIKFNFKNTDVFEYSNGDSRKKIKQHASRKMGKAPVTKDDGQCCQIF